MAKKPNYRFEKRQREKRKADKKAEKALKKSPSDEDTDRTDLDAPPGAHDTSPQPPSRPGVSSE